MAQFSDIKLIHIFVQPWPAVISRIFYHPKLKLSPFDTSSPFPHPQALLITALLLAAANMTILGTSVKQNHGIWKLSCPACLFSMSSRVIYAAQNFILFSDWMMFHCMHMLHFVHLVIHWWTFGCFPLWLLWIMLLWVYKYRLEFLLSIFWSIYPHAKLQDHHHKDLYATSL